MFKRLSNVIVAAGAAASIGAGALIPRPASADTTSTILTAAAAIGAVVLYSNIQRKQAAANTVVGYTRNGGTVYADGRVVMANGQTYYPNSNTNGQYGYNYPVNNGQYNAGQYNNGQYNNGQYNNGQYNNGQYNNGRYNNGRSNGQYTNDGRRWNTTANNAATDNRNRDRDRDHR